ncbi:endonuclease MutS2 [Longimicrobium sp.]|uniref:endonuclease MutS2 n=1 Tax=Longimicrobium sp. TaxID=2029185 RepID=UPI002E31BF36|nr:endonuclease MutS2 [Longimicrobium sp.]HEX6037356.1 endonuclease MutS2 [Longimicrobium sp.]
MNPHALNVLEYREALDLVARFASSGLGADAVRALSPSADLAWIEPELARVEEMRGFLRGDNGWQVPAVPDAREALRKMRVEGSVLDGPQLRDVGVLLTSARTTRRAVMQNAGSLPYLSLIAGGLVEREKDEAEIARTVDDAGLVRDEASPVLYRARREIKSTRGRLVERLAAYMASMPSHHQVPDASVTVRDGRYVIPVRREGRGEVGGIVHDESATGATLFVEPPVAVEMMNRLRELEAEEAREVTRILREATAKLRPIQPDLLASLDALVVLDSLYARARYALRTDGRMPRMLEAGTEEYEVNGGAHPILLARSQSVVPFDLRMDRGERTLLISGPNTGGKTVLLKAMGLISLLAQSGIVPPVGPATKLPVFRDVFADVGDEQSIEASLSTFSAHLKNLREVLDGADWQSLVLTDEIGSGTDPQEGAALARAVLVELTRRSSFTVATTHLGQLKLLATEEPGIVNASLQFDAERLQPTYRLLKGVPGRSYGLAIARRLGLEPRLLEEAEATLPQGERDVAKLLLELEAKEQRFADQNDLLARRLAETQALREKLEAREQELKQKEKDAERRARQQARDLLLQSRAEVEAAIREVRDAADADKLEEAARAARRRVEEAAQRQREKQPSERSARGGGKAKRGAIQALEPGLRVRIESLGRTGTIVDLRDGKALVEAGSIRLSLPRDDLTPLPPGDQEAQSPRPRPSAGYVNAGSDARPEVDLRGMRPDEVDVVLGRAMDSAIMAGLPSFRIIHGKGTGALRAHVRKLLESDRRISVARPGELFEGGTGVTVVEFA